MLTYSSSKLISNSKKKTKNLYHKTFDNIILSKKNQRYKDQYSYVYQSFFINNSLIPSHFLNKIHLKRRNTTFIVLLFKIIINLLLWYQKFFLLCNSNTICQNQSHVSFIWHFIHLHNAWYNTSGDDSLTIWRSKKYLFDMRNIYEVEISRINKLCVSRFHWSIYVFIVEKKKNNFLFFVFLRVFLVSQRRYK